MPEFASQRSARVMASVLPIYQFIFASAAARLLDHPEASNFAFGNPHEMPLKGFVDALQKWSVPQHKDWYAYPDDIRSAKAIVQETLREMRGLPFERDDIFMTNGAFGGLAASINALVDSGDEVIFISPPWFFYEALILNAGGVPVRVKINPANFDLDLDAIAAAITPRTRAIIVNSPNNPTGKIYPAETLQALASLLTSASQRHGRTIYLLSDEAYSRIVFDGKTYPSPVAHYPHTLLIYTYGKTLLTPGQRIGYVALPPTMPEREMLRNALFLAQFVTGYAFPNALLQHALGDLEKLSISIPHYQQKRDRMVAALREAGYEVHAPEGTFYLLPRSPIPDDQAFVDLLAQHHIVCLPGTVVEMPGYFRISLTANDEMIDRALQGFAAAREQALQKHPG
jgi:aspartate aminotransferase